MSDTQLGPQAQRPHRENHDHRHKDVARVIAAAFVNAGGVLLGKSPGIANLMHTPATGIYAITLDHPPDDPNNTTVAATIIDFLVGGQITWILDGSLVLVCTYNAAGVPTDRNFSIVVYDRS